MLALSWPRGLQSGIIHADLFPRQRLLRQREIRRRHRLLLRLRRRPGLRSGCLSQRLVFRAGRLVQHHRRPRPGGGLREPAPPVARGAGRLAILAHGAAMRFFLTRLIDWGRADEGALVRPKDPMEYERKPAVSPLRPGRPRPVRRLVTPVVIYTDGACSGNPGPGGWGAVLISSGKEKDIMGGETHTTNNRMEMMAAIKALQLLTRPPARWSFTPTVSTCARASPNGWRAGRRGAGRRPTRSP